MHKLLNYSQILKLFVVCAALATLRLVDLGNNWVTDALQVLKLLGECVLVRVVVSVYPVLSLGQRVGDRAFVLLTKLGSQLLLVLNCVAHLVDVVVQLVLCVDLFFQ